MVVDQLGIGEQRNVMPSSALRSVAPKTPSFRVFQDGFGFLWGCRGFKKGLGESCLSAMDPDHSSAASEVCPACGAPYPVGGEGGGCPVCLMRGALGSGAASDGALADEKREPPDEGRFDHYEVLRHADGAFEELGRGAMGITYRAFDTVLGHAVALKVLDARVAANPQARERFLREARLAARLRHPNVASVFYYGVRKGDGQCFYAMELVEGESVEARVRRAGPLPVPVALEVVAQVARALAAAEAQGLVHRDLKPANLMLVDGPVLCVKVIDFGLAKAAADLADADLTQGGFVGTPAFASPEQCVGSGVDVRSDLYSLGVTLWVMLSGQAPFRGSAAEVRQQHRRAPLPLEQLQGVPQPVVVLLELLLEKDQARRFQSPTELLQALPAVTAAIEAGGRRLRKTIRVLVSSTGDVQKERHLAERVMRSAAAEFNVPVSASTAQFQRLAEANGEPDPAPEQEYAPWVLCPYFLDDQRRGPGAAYQGWLPNPADFELVICLLWSRLAVLPDPALKLPDGARPGSGTEYELAWAVDRANKNQGIPPVRIYRNGSPPTPPLEPKGARDAFIRQWDALQELFSRWETEGPLADTCYTYRNLGEFEDLFRAHFHAFLAAQVEPAPGPNALTKKVRRWHACPFRGLNAFHFEHAPIFHGRTKAVGDVLEALEGQLWAQRPFVLVVGASGSGKSSLVRAGVLPLLTQPGTIEGVGLWRRAVTRPGAGGSDGDCFDALAAALLEPAALPALQDPESANAVRDLATELRGHAEGAALRVRDALDHAAREWKLQRAHQLDDQERHLRQSGSPDEAAWARCDREGLALPKARLALVVDQLEELFTSGFSPQLRQKYISALAGLVGSGRVFILATLRSDFYPRYQEFPELIELTKPAGKVDLRPPTPYEVGNMIRLPAEAAGLRFEQEPATGQRLDQALRDAAAATPESLPLLEHVLSLLYDKQAGRGDGLLRWSDYRELGELKGALAQHAEAVFSTLGAAEQRAFRVVMRQLVTLGQAEEEAPNRRTVPYREFVTVEGVDDDQKTGAKGFVDRFIEKRLLVADTDPRGEVTVSVAHEALLREWGRVKAWLAENREFLRMRDRLEASRKLWLSRGKQKDDLLGPGLPLAEGEKLVHHFGPSLSREQTDYIYASVTERKRRKHIQGRIRSAVMAAISVLALVAGFQWLRAERQRRSAAQAFASEAQLAAKLQEQLRQASWASFNQAERQFQLGEWQEAIALLARAIRFDPANHVASERFFHELIVHREKALPRLIAAFAHQDLVNAAVFSPDGARILTASWDKTAKLWDAASGKLLASFAHQDAVNAAVFSPDGARILTSGGDPSAKLWEAASGKLLASFAHQDLVNAAAFSPDGARILTASADKTARLWEAASGKLLASFSHQDAVNDAAFSPDGARIVTAGADKTARLWDAASGELITSFGHQGIVYHAAFSPDGARVLTASRDKTAKLWDGSSGKLLASFEHQDTVSGAVFSPDGTRILTASWDETAKLWDAASGKLLASFDHQDVVNAAVFSPDGTRILTASWDKTAKLWDAASGKLLASFGHQDPLENAVFSPDGARILTASWDKTAKLWDAASGKPLASFDHQDAVNDAAFSPDGIRVLTAGADKAARLWDAASGKLLVSFAHQDGVNAVVFSPDGARVLTASADNTARLWDAASGKPLASFNHQDAVVAAAFSPDGARILTASRDKTARLWDAASGKPLASFEHQDSLNNAAFSPDGARILTASADKTAKLWEAASGKLLTSFNHRGEVSKAAFSPDGTRILTASADHRAKLWEAASGKLLTSFDHQDEVSEAVFSPDGARILTGGMDKTAKLWEAASGKLIASFVHQANVYHGAFSPDGARILTASADNTTNLWDAASGKLLASFGHQDAVRWAAFSPDGAWVLTASWDKTAKLWDVTTPAALARQVKASAGDAARMASPVSMAGAYALQVEALSAIASGLQFSDDGSLVAVSEERRAQLTSQLKELARDVRPDARFIRWFFSAGSDRTIFPASDVKMVAWVDNVLLTNPNLTDEFLRNALGFLPAHPLLHIALAGSETDSKRADFLRSFGLARLPKNSVACTRAAEMLLAQHRPDLALVAVDHALLANPADLPAKRLRLQVLVLLR
jgi:WD40 repeat protein